MLLSICLSALTFASAAKVADTTRVVVVATTDVHGRATAWEDDGRTPFGGGLTRVATVVDSLRKRYPGQVVLVDAGDLIQGNAFAGHFARAPRRPHPVIDAMNALGYDAATLGNHEFNFGLDFLRITLSDAAYPYVTANVFSLPTRRTLYRPEVVLKRGAVRVGITGFTTPGVMVWDGDSVKGRVEVQRIGDVAPATLARLRRASDLMVVLIHSGMGPGSSYDTTGVGPENVAATLADLPDAPDLVVVGHSHREMRDTVVGKTHFVQPRNWAQSVTVTHVLMVSDGSAWRVARVQGDVIPLANVAPQSRLEQRLAPQRVIAAHAYAQPVARATAPFPAQLSRAEPTPLIGYIHWVQRRRTGAQLSAAAAFRTDAGLPQGDVTQGHFAAIYSYENTLRALKISGAQLKAFLEHSARYYRLSPEGRPAIDPAVPGYNYDMVSGAQYLIDLTRPIGDRIVGLSVGGRVVQPADSFTIAINSYRAAGGGGYDMLKGARLVYEKGENVRDLLVMYAESLKVLEPARFAERNWRWADTVQAQGVAALFGGRSTQEVGQQLSDLPRWRPVPVADTITVRVLALNDLHGALLPRTYPWSNGRPVGGVAAMSAWMDSAEAQCRCLTLRLDAGDQLQGTLESNLVYGASTVAAMNQLRLNGAAIGNHEFDWSTDTLRARLKEAKYPWLAANVFDSTTGLRVPWIRSHAVINVGPLRVALIGFVSRQTKGIVKAENAKGLMFGAGVNTFRDVLDSVKAQRPDLTILLAHEGGFCDSLACRGEVFELSEELRPGDVDLIVSGHTHSRLATTSRNGVPIVQARSNGTALGIVDLKRAGGKWTAAARVETVYADVVKPDAAMERLIYDVRKRTDPIATRVMARFRVPLPKVSEAGEYALGNLIADAQRVDSRAEAALMNNGGIRAGLPAGVITYEQLYQLQPFGNQIVVVDLTGAQVLAALEHALKDGQPDAHVSGIVVKWDSSRAPGKRVREVRFTNGNRKLDPKRRYRVAVNDYMAGGGSGFVMLRSAPAEPTGKADIEVLQAYLARLPQPADPPSTGRFQRTR